MAKNLPLFALGGALLLALHTAAAQYVWVDEKGVKQYSDQPPPTTVPNSKILKSPGKSTAQESESGKSTEAGSADQKIQKPVTLSSRNEDFNKRRTEQAEKDRKTAEAAQAANDKKKNCERAQSFQKALESGIPMARMGGDGERNYLTDEQRAQELNDVKRATSGCK